MTRAQYDKAIWNAHQALDKKGMVLVYIAFKNEEADNNFRKTIWNWGFTNEHRGYTWGFVISNNCGMDCTRERLAYLLSNAVFYKACTIRVM